jgi:hypothetical protein
MENFVKNNSIVKTIWSDTDCILFIFGACAGEFAYSKSIDWLFYTGKLPNDPIGRLFSTVNYAQQIVFTKNAEDIIRSIVRIHKKIEEKRGYPIPNEAYKDVLSMLINYSASVYELLYRPISKEEYEEIYDVFKRIGVQMELQNLPDGLENWQKDRELSLENNYINSSLTKELFTKYKIELGPLRYKLLLVVQSFLLDPRFVNQPNRPIWSLLFYFYKKTKHLWPIKEVKYLLLPKQYQDNLKKMINTKSKIRCPFADLA